MCGIVGAVAARNVTPLLLEGHGYNNRRTATVDTIVAVLVGLMPQEMERFMSFCAVPSSSRSKPPSTQALEW